MYPSLRSTHSFPYVAYLIDLSTARSAPNAQGKRHRSTEGAEGTNKGQDNGEALALVGVRLTAQLGDGFWALARYFIAETVGVTLASRSHA